MDMYREIQETVGVDIVLVEGRCKKCGDTLSHYLTKDLHRTRTSIPVGYQFGSGMVERLQPDGVFDIFSRCEGCNTVNYEKAVVDLRSGIFKGKI